MGARTWTSGRRQGFSLMEMLMVIVIISTLLAIGLVAGANFRRDARLKQVKTVLDVCRAAATEYQAVTGLVINHSGFNPADGTTNNIRPFDWQELTDPGKGADSKLAALNNNAEQDDEPDNPQRVTNVYIERFVWAVSQVPSAYKMLGGEKAAEKSAQGQEIKMEQLSRFLVDTDGDHLYEIVDPFGRPLAYAAFVDHDDHIARDDYLPEHPKPFFASAGLDGKWGEAKSEEELVATNYANFNETKAEQAKDNIYSFTNE